MPHLTLSLLGGAAIRLDDEPVTGFTSAKALALVVYLALRPGVHGRLALADLLWGESLEEKARVSLRQALANLRKLLPGVFTATRQEVALAAGVVVESDVALLQAALAGDDLAALEAAVAAYRGPFLTGLDVKGAPTFEAWRYGERERLEGLAVAGLGQLAAAALADGLWGDAVDHLRRSLVLDPTQEDVHRDLMLALARDGDYTAALKQYERCRAILHETLGVEPMPETVALYERLSTLRGQTRRTTLPPPASPFIGRAAALAALDDNLRDPTARLVTITGMGGAGKTRLALEAGRRFQGRFLDGVVFVPLAGLSASGDVVAAVGRALELPVAGRAEPRAQLLAYLRGRELLLILDNAEHVLPACGAFVSRVVAQAPDVSVVVTSRQALDLPVERRLALGGLVTGANGDPSEAEALFAQAARRRDAGFDLAANADCVRELCALVEGLPLALELAAAWVGSLPCEGIVDAVRERPARLERPAAAGNDRHRSLEATFAHSWRSLTDDERAALLSLTVFAGSWDLAATTAVTGAAPEVVRALVEKSLLQLSADGRYQLHTLLRQLIVARDDNVPVNWPALRRRHAAHYAAVLAAEGERIGGDHTSEALRRIGVDIPNVHVAWRAAVDLQAWALVDQALTGLRRYHVFRGPFDEGEGLAALAIDALRADPAAQEAERPLLGRLLLALSNLTLEAGRYEEADDHARAALEIARREETDELLAGAHRRRAKALWHKGAFADAREQFQQALTVAQAADLAWAEAEAIRGLGMVYWGTGDLPSAREQFERAQTLYERVGDRRGQSFALNHLGIIDSEAHALRRSRAQFEAALTLAERLDNTALQAMIVTNLATIFGRQGAVEQARPALERALQMHRDLGARRGEAATLNSLAFLASRVGQVRQAYRRREQALEIFRDIGDRLSASLLWTFQGRHWHYEGEPRRALACGDEAWRLCEAMGDNGRVRAETLIVLGYGQGDLGHWDNARDHFFDAHRVLRQLTFPNLAAEVALGLANVHLAMDNISVAQESIEDALKFVETGRSVPSLIRLEIHWVGYRCLTKDFHRRARALLAMAYEEMTAVADRLTDARQRAVWLGLPAHRAIRDAWTAENGG